MSEPERKYLGMFAAKSSSLLAAAGRTFGLTSSTPLNVSVADKGSSNWADESGSASLGTIDNRPPDVPSSVSILLSIALSHNLTA